MSARVPRPSVDNNPNSGTPGGVVSAIQYPASISLRTSDKMEVKKPGDQWLRGGRHPDVCRYGMRDLREMRIPGLSRRCEHNGERQGAIQSAPGIGSTQFNRRADARSRGVPEWTGRGGFGEAGGRIGRSWGSGRDTGCGLDCRYSLDRPRSILPADRSPRLRLFRVRRAPTLRRHRFSRKEGAGARGGARGSLI